ncbi:bifunctional hydroxy-methylpyrimidine kinase/ hydroxy-phosphomethylpyrimidine kinase [Synechococcus sp. BIOS-U3-1]|uniref:bifunctional hydroxymethylpyrimidine kinase/phosphomethylpyrimidine kinase n=1 Tax=Synechococcus sp. BIOS-U3-1 TaxID=1400865 RepID=UPI0016477E26|nr:bifunctional hydroxymethylpyrimidine kinase/phosphomethylpyrimidine kinase [Synechococcus sp. BIOS-U3-1]QNI59160.1 bifunctional hydroxy-methylpyrimidine kinase/ hydroxy-phosphomethylpyrimidine kinase [Synechococcus sp. BIOS-U3-1]
MQAEHITPPIALTIAGSDSGGGAGIQADLRAFMAFRVHGCSALSCVTAQNTCEVVRVDPIPPAGLKAQLQAVKNDLSVEALKTGMLLNTELIQTTAELLKRWTIPKVIDPVMVSRTGAVLLKDEAITALRQDLLPLATLLTPNRHEAQLLSGHELSDDNDIETAAAVIHAQGPAAVLIKSGSDRSMGGRDLLFDGQPHWLEGVWVDTPHTHGTGCTLSAAITAGLALGQDLDVAITAARAYVKRGLKQALAIGQGQGPICHWAEIKDIKKSD